MHSCFRGLGVPLRPSESDRSGGLLTFVSPIIPAGIAALDSLARLYHRRATQPRLSPTFARARRPSGTMRRVFSKTTRHIGTPWTAEKLIQLVSALKGKREVIRVSRNRRTVGRHGAHAPGRGTARCWLRTSCPGVPGWALTHPPIAWQSPGRTRPCGQPRLQSARRRRRAP
jgi:hypothetical protein